MSTRHWWKVLVLVLAVGLAGVAYMAVRTYQDAPPIPDFTTPNGEILISQASILRGQAVFQKYALMEYGSMFGDGAGRGPDFTADALHQMAVAMQAHHRGQAEDPNDPFLKAGIQARVRQEIKTNRFDPAKNATRLTQAQVDAYDGIAAHSATVLPRHVAERLTLAERQDLSSFFFWGAWVCGAQRPGESYSYTHNWPYDEAAGNTATPATLFWSAMGLFGLILGLGVVLFARGKATVPADPPDRGVLTIDRLRQVEPTPAQRATHPFFVAAGVLFLLQVLAGVLTVHDFLGVREFMGMDVTLGVPPTVSRSWHLQWALLWVAACWIGASIFVLPLLTGGEPKGQKALTHLLFSLLLVMVLGSSAGILLGPMGVLGDGWRIFGHQGWEFMEAGVLWQGLLFGALGLWCLIVFRGVRPTLRRKDLLALPNWLFYAILSILVLFTAGFVSGPETNFVIADFWRWVVIHMWVEAFLEVFTTIIVAAFFCVMGLVSWQSARRTVFLATVLFLGSGMLGISHNFYWNAKPMITLAVGSVFSTLQVVPLILLAMEAWKTKELPRAATEGQLASFSQSAAFLFLLGVNFWNVFGAGVMGLLINLPIVNYYEHGTYLTVNHGHAAFMGVYGNLSLAALLFCTRFLVPVERWNDRVPKVAFWSLNLGLLLMVLLDLFPVGLMQLQAVLEHGLWYARSLDFVAGSSFQTLTWLRAVGGYLFFFGGVLPMVWFVVSRFWRARGDRVGHPMNNPG